MKRSIQISIPTPCHENWDKMTPADKGHFCASCQKTVFDFTNSSDREIASVLKNTDSTCGRFRNTQLDRELIVPKEKSSLWMAASAAIVSFLTIGTHSISAQTPVSIEQTDSKTDDIIGKVIPSQSIIINGTVFDSQDLPLPGTNIENIQAGKITQADFDGKFSIEAHEGDVLKFTFPGMQTKEITVTKKGKYNAVMLEEELMGDMVIISSKHKTFFGRIFHSIGNIFR